MKFNIEFLHLHEISNFYINYVERRLCILIQIIFIMTASHLMTLNHTQWREVLFLYLCIQRKFISFFFYHVLAPTLAAYSATTNDAGIFTLSVELTLVLHARMRRYA